MGTSWSKTTRGKQTNGDPKNKKVESHASREVAKATRTMPGSVQTATKQEAKQREELIADWDEMQETTQREELIAEWDEMYVGVSMMLSVSKFLELSCRMLLSSDINNSQSVRTSFVDFRDPPSEFILYERTEKTSRIVI